MNALDEVLADLGQKHPCEQRAGSWWTEAPTINVRKLSQAMMARGARFVTMTGVEQTDGTIRIDYHWDLEGQLLTVTTTAVDKEIASITEIVPAADWVEREIHEYFAVEFEGRRDTKPLMLRDGDRLGIHLRKGGQNELPHSDRAIPSGSGRTI